jgi:hypothetical protein
VEMCRLGVGAANPLFSCGERSDVPRLQQVEEKAVGRQMLLRISDYVMVTNIFDIIHIQILKCDVNINKHLHGWVAD